MTSTQPTHTWTPNEVLAAFDLHTLFLRNGRIGPEYQQVLERCSPKILRAARTIADVAMFSDVTVPACISAPERLPIADAVILQSSLEDWYSVDVNDAPDLAYEHLNDLAALYETAFHAWTNARLEPMEARLIGSCVLLPKELELTRNRLAELRQHGADESVLARGLAWAVTGNTEAARAI